MTTYKDVYSYRIIDEIKNGKRVYAVDRKLAELFVVNSLEMDEFAILLHRAEADRDRYIFWMIEEDIDND